MTGHPHGRAVSDAGEARQRVRERIAQLERLPVGEGVPVTEFHAAPRRRPAVSVQATGVRVDAAGGPATLSIMFDITARQRRRGGAAPLRGDAVAALRHQPGLIALSEVDSGRYAMVNAAFTPLTGYAAEEVVGRTADRARPLARPEGSRPAARRARRRRPRRRDAGARSRTRAGAARVGAGLGGALRRWTGATTSSSTRATSPTPSARGSSTQAILRARLDRHRLHPRPPLRAGQPALRGDVRLAGRRAARPAGRGASGRATPTTPRSAGSPGRCSPPASRSRSSARCGARRQPVLVPPARRRRSTRTTRATAARSGSPRT